VAEPAHAFVPALEGIAAAGRYGRSDGDPGVIVSEVIAAGLASMVARWERSAALADAVGSAFGMDLPAAGRWAQADRRCQGLSLVWSGPGRWLACKIPAPAEGMEDYLRAGCGSLAAIVDQSHAGMLLNATGRCIRDALAKGLPIDLDPRAFGIGHAAVTAVAHVGVHLWQINELPTYRLLVPRSYAGSFWHWLSASAAEYGLGLDEIGTQGVHARPANGTARAKGERVGG
jgi:methylglutamate dehydrogenase subunit D